MERAVREADSADEGFRDIQMPEAEQKSMMNLSCQYVVTGGSQTPQAIKLAGALGWEVGALLQLLLHYSSDPQISSGLNGIYGLLYWK